MRKELALVLILTACATDRDPGGPVPRGVGPDPIPKLDILFVVDNSGSMSEEQTSLATNFPRFMNELESLPMGAPDLHIAVVSSNVGISPFQTTGCVGNGDDGTFQNAPRGACTPPSGYYISDEADPGGGGVRITNYPATTTLPDVFSCIARLGSNGCGLEQHLESMKRALDGHRPENANFLRDDAFLAVIIIADEDDCSAEDGTMFDPSQNDISDPLGPFGSFRCPEFGITCAEGNIARSPASYTDCVPRSDSLYMYHPDHYVEFLNGLKADPNRIIVAGIIGNATPVEVLLDTDGNPEMGPSCGAGTASTAAPGVRLQYFLDQFPDRSTFTSICNEDLSDGLATIGVVVRNAIIDFPTLPDAGVPPDPGADGEDSGGCSAAGAHGGAGAFGALVLLGLALVPAFRRRKG
jgi:MYXO-CTERM domain-containing protein